MVADMLSAKKIQSVVIELFIRTSKLKIYLSFITQSYLFPSKNTRLTSIHNFVMKIQSKRKIHI